MFSSRPCCSGQNLCLGVSAGAWPPRALEGAGVGGLDPGRGLQDGCVLEAPADQLRAHRQAVRGQAARHRACGQKGVVEERREDRVRPRWDRPALDGGRPRLREGPCGARRGRREQQVDVREQRGEGPEHRLAHEEGGGDRAARRREPLLDLRRNIGVEARRVGAERLPVERREACELERHQRRLIRALRPSRVAQFDGRADGGEGLRRALHRLRHVRPHEGADAEARAVGDAEPRERSPERRRGGGRLELRRRHRVARVEAGDGIEQGGGIGDGPRHLTDRLVAEDGGLEADRVRHEPGRGLEPDDPGMRRRTPGRAAPIGAERERPEAGGDSARRPAGGAARCAFEVPRVARRPEQPVRGDTLAGEFGAVGQAKEHAARAAQPLDSERVGGGHEVREQGRALAYDATLNPDVVLDGEGDPEQGRRVAAPQALVRALRLGAHRIGIEADDGVQERVRGLDRGDGGLGGFGSRDFAPAEKRRQFECGGVADAAKRHRRAFGHRSRGGSGFRSDTHGGPPACRHRRPCLGRILATVGIIHGPGVHGNYFLHLACKNLLRH